MASSLTRFGRILALASFALLVGCKPGDYSASSDTMINHFAGSCRSSMGTWSNTALNQSQSLLAALQTAKEQQNKDCAGVTQALQATQQIQSRLSEMAKDPVINAYRAKEEKKLELSLALARLKNDPQADANLMNSLREEFYATELALVQARADASSTSDARRRSEVGTALMDLHQYVLQLTSQGNLSACLASAPQMPLGIASSLLSIGGNFATPVVGTGLAAIGNLMSTTVTYLRKLPIEKAELDLKNAQMQMALTCSLEAMSNLYCDAESSSRFVDFALSSYKKQGKISPTWQGLDLLGRRLPILNRWLVKASSGVDPSDPYAAARLNEAWRKQSSLREVKNSVQGQINQTKRLLEGIEGSELDLRQKAGFKAVITSLFNGSPVSDFVNQYATVCRLSGNPQCAIPDSGSRDWDAMIDKYGIVGGFAALEERTKVLLDEITTLVSKELLSAINQDPDALVAEATQPSLDNWSVYQVLIAASEFSKQYALSLQQVSPTNRPGRDRAIAMAEETARLLKEIADGIAGGESSLEVINAAFKKFKLLDGTQFINNRLSQIVRWDLENRIRSKQLPADVTEDLITSGITLGEQLERSGINLRTDAEAVVNDIKSAQYISRENLRITLEIFASTINKLLVEIKSSAQAAGETDPLDPANRRLAQLCVLALTTAPQVTPGLDLTPCKGAKLVSAYRQSGIELSFDTLSARIAAGKFKRYTDRVCVYSNFLSASRLFQLGRTPTLLPEGARFATSASRLSPLVNSRPFSWESFRKIPASWQAIEMMILGY